MRSPALAYSLFAAAAALAPALVAAAPPAGFAQELSAAGISVPNIRRASPPNPFSNIAGNNPANSVSQLADAATGQSNNGGKHGGGDKHYKGHGDNNAAETPNGQLKAAMAGGHGQSNLGRRAAGANTAGGNDAYSGATKSEPGGSVVTGSDHTRGQFAQFAESDLNH